MIITHESIILNPLNDADHDLLSAISDGLNQRIVAGESTRQDRFLARAIKRADPTQPGWLGRHLLGREYRPVGKVEINDYTYESMTKAIETNRDFEERMQGPELASEHVRYAASVLTELSGASLAEAA